MSKIVKRLSVKLVLAIGALCCIFCPAFSYAGKHTPKKSELEKCYQAQCSQPSDIYQHLPALKQLASECSSAVEIGVRSMVSTWAILQGLSESKSFQRSYIGIDLNFPPHNSLEKGRRLAESQGIHFQFWEGNDMALDIPQVDLLFIDSLHTYCHLTYELEKFSPMTCKYIAMHDTSEPWGLQDDSEYHGDYSEYDPAIDRTKRGLWPAVVDFLARHPEWSLYRRHMYNHGFTVLKRIETPLEEDSDVSYALNNKIILCTGPSLNQKTELKAITENDLKFIPFKKIFLSTQDQNNLDVRFGQHLPVVQLFSSQDQRLDCLNCILSSIHNAVSDPDSLDDDIILFKHESVFLNDIHLFKKAIGKILAGYDAVTRFNGLDDMTDVFLIKVAAARKAFANHSFVTGFGRYQNCEQYCFNEIFNQLLSIYRIPNKVLRHWEDNELGFFHIAYSKGDYWNKSNYNDLYKD